jgi:hypothetical protein
MQVKCNKITEIFDFRTQVYWIFYIRTEPKKTSLIYEHLIEVHFALSGTREYAITSEVHESAMFLLGNYKVRDWNGLRWLNVHI